MTDEPHTPLSAWSEWVSIKMRFEWLVTAGHKPIAARALLTDWLESDNIETEPPLPQVYKIRLLPGDGIAIDTDGTDAGLIDRAQVLSRVRPKPRAVPRVRPLMVFRSGPGGATRRGGRGESRPGTGRRSCCGPIRPAGRRPQVRQDETDS